VEIFDEIDDGVDYWILVFAILGLMPYCLT